MRAVTDTLFSALALGALCLRAEAYVVGTAGTVTLRTLAQNASCGAPTQRCCIDPNGYGDECNPGARCVEAAGARTCRKCGGQNELCCSVDTPSSDQQSCPIGELDTQRLTCNSTITSEQSTATRDSYVATEAEAAKEFCSPCGGVGQPCCREDPFLEVGLRKVCSTDARCVTQGDGKIPLCAACGRPGALCCSPPETYEYDKACPVAAETLQHLSCSLLIEPGSVASLDSTEICEACGQRDQPCCRDIYGDRTACSTGNLELQLLCIPSAPVNNTKPINTCRACGGIGEPCCPYSLDYDSETCPTHRRPNGQRLTCSGDSDSDIPSQVGKCQRCGKIGQPCCYEGVRQCDAGVAQCVAASGGGGGVCAACGKKGQPCCAGEGDAERCTAGTAAAPLTCSVGSGEETPLLAGSIACIPCVASEQAAGASPPCCRDTCFVVDSTEFSIPPGLAWGSPPPAAPQQLPPPPTAPPPTAANDQPAVPPAPTASAPGASGAPAVAPGAPAGPGAGGAPSAVPGAPGAPGAPGGDATATAVAVGERGPPGAPTQVTINSPPAPDSTNSPPAPDSDGGDNTTPIVAGAVGGSVVLALLGLAAACYVVRERRRKRLPDPPPAPDMPASGRPSVSHMLHTGLSPSGYSYGSAPPVHSGVPRPAPPYVQPVPEHLPWVASGGAQVMQPSPHAASPDPVGSGTVVHDVHSSVRSSVHTTPHAPAAAVAVKNGVRTDGRAASSAGARTHNSSLSVQSTRTRESGAPAATLGSDPTWPLNVAEGGGGQLASLERALDWLVDTRQPFLGSYTVLGGHASRAVGGQGLVQFVRRTHGAEEFAIKFYTYRPAFERERALYNDTALQSMMPATREIVSNEDGAVAAQGFAFPPCIVLERGESLETWALREDRDFITTLQVLHHVAQRLLQMHKAGWAHLDLKPGNILRRPQKHAWTLIDFGCSCSIGTMRGLSYSLQYVAPEVLAAVEAGDASIETSAAADIWALGVIAYELLTNSRAFGMGTTRAVITAQVLGREAAPWEQEPRAVGAKLRGLRRSVMSCLQRDPEQRPTAVQLVEGWEHMFDTIQTRNDM